jgi:hypothetical protein
MLKNKKAIYVLIPLNIFVWGFFIYRFMSAYIESDIPSTERSPITTKTEKIEEDHAYTLNLNYKDPFLKSSPQVINLPTNNSYGQVQKKSKPKDQIVPEQKKLPDVKYLGLIKNNSTGLSTALISVNGQSKLIKQNDVVDGILFKTFSKDSLVAKCGKERIIVRK